MKQKTFFMIFKGLTQVTQISFVDLWKSNFNSLSWNLVTRWLLLLFSITNTFCGQIWSQIICSKYKLVPENIFIISWDFFMLHQICLSLQVKRSTTISNKFCIYKLLHKLPNNFKTKNLRKVGRIRKISNPARIIN